MSAHETITTDRLVLTAPTANDAEAIFRGYASDPEVTAFVGWPRHQSIDDTFGFIEFSNSEWSRSSVGPYLIRSRDDGRLLGSTGISCTGRGDAMTGYVLARSCWGNGYATEAVRAMIVVARDLKLQSLFALCHPDHQASCHVLVKTGFQIDTTWSEPVRFPNLAEAETLVPLCYRMGLA